MQGRDLSVGGINTVKKINAVKTARHRQTVRHSSSPSRTDRLQLRLKPAHNKHAEV